MTNRESEQAAAPPSALTEAAYALYGVVAWAVFCLLYTSDAADERSSVDLGGRRIIKNKNKGEARRGGVHSIEKTQDHESDALVKRMAYSRVPTVRR